MSSKTEALQRTILQQSKSNRLSTAAQEWVLKALPPKLDSFVSCEACGTPIKRTARIFNPARGTTLIIGLVCYVRLLEMLRRSEIRTSLVRPEAFLRVRRENFERAFSARYVDYMRGVDLRSWKGWMLVTAGADSDAGERVLVGVAELRAYGHVVSDEAIEACIRYHDRKRLFPVSVLLPEGWRRWAPDTSSIITIEQAAHIMERRPDSPSPQTAIPTLADRIGTTSASTTSPALALRRFVKQTLNRSHDVDLMQKLSRELSNVSGMERLLHRLFEQARAAKDLGPVIVGDVVWTKPNGFWVIDEFEDGHPIHGASRMREIHSKRRRIRIRHVDVLNLPDWFHRTHKMSDAELLRAA